MCVYVCLCVCVCVYVCVCVCDVCVCVCVCVNLLVQIINNTFYLTSGITVLFEKIKKSRISPDFMQTEGSVPCSQQLVTCSYHAPLKTYSVHEIPPCSYNMF